MVRPLNPRMARPQSKQDDPISERSRALNAEIATLEAQIRELDTQLVSARSHGRPDDSRAPHQSPGDMEPPAFEPMNRPAMPAQGRFLGAHARTDTAEAAKPDPGRGTRGRKKKAAATAAHDPRLINYLAAGGIQGLRPLRYEKRVARNRVLTLALILFFVLWGLVALLRN
jgi:hypothetical protein